MTNRKTLIGIFLVSLGLRIVAIDVPINLDEVSWLERGAEFFRQFLEGDWHDTYLRHHPGVPNMWLTGLGMFLNCQLRQSFPEWFDLAIDLNLRACMKTEAFPISLFVLPRLLQAIVTSAGMVGFYLLTQRLVGRSIAAMATILLLFEPFFLAYQRFLTTDALQTDFTVLGLLLLLLYLRGNSSQPQRFPRLGLIASGVLVGLATAAKIPALFVLPGVAMWVVAIEWGWWQPQFQPRGWRRQLLDIALWLGIVLLTFYAIWPALWVAPIATLEKLYQGLQQESHRGFFFFLGQMTDSPNLLFYPVVLLYQFSPALLLGVAIVLFPAKFNKTKPQPELAAMAMVTASVLLSLSLLSSKIDRYLLPIVPFLEIGAAVGWLRLWQALDIPKNRVKLLGFALAAMQAIVLIPYFPYYLTYFNPLFGGSRVAKHLLMVGQGEGLERAARWLNQSPNARQMLVASGYSGAFAPYFHGETVKISRDLPSDAKLRWWMQANRVVLYINQFQRQIPDPRFLAYFNVQQPLYDLKIDGLDYVRVYPGPTPLPEDLQRIQHPKTIAWDASYRANSRQNPAAVRLLGYDLKGNRFFPSDRAVVSLYWKFPAPPPPDLEVEISLVDNSTGETVSRDREPLVGGYLKLENLAANAIVRDVHSLALAPFLTPGRYTLHLAWIVSGNLVDRSGIGLEEIRIDRRGAK
ncbi:MAG TPA: glycosyltransferase family 39 protein [Oscillatoriales cyanobacterium M59_W2019_021]|nr:glycosyltransferase family 39 protein [Oscillatoriales cyanobacterium M59_W2019_021]